MQDTSDDTVLGVLVLIVFIPSIIMVGHLIRRG